MPANANYSQTAGRALDVLSLFLEKNGLTLSEVARLTGLSTTIAYRLLYTLHAKGFLSQDARTKVYTLGESVLLLGYKAIHSQSLQTLARPVLRDLTAATGRESFLNVCVGGKSLCLEKVLAGNELQAAMCSGSVYPLHKGASSRVLLAFLPQEEREGYLDGLCAHEPPGEIEALRRELGRIRAQGCDYTEGQLSVGLFSVACPVFGTDGELVASLSVGGPTGSATGEEMEQYRLRTQEAARRLGRLLGFQESRQMR